MKSRIKKILIEEYDRVPDLPIETTWANGKRIPIATPSKTIFFKAVQQIVATDPGNVLANDDSTFEDRSYEMTNVLKLFGLSTNYEVLVNKIFWAAFDNQVGIEDGSVNSFDDLELRQLKEYNVECYENWREYVSYTWQPIVEAYSEDDAANMVQMDEDGYYQYYEWDNKPGFDRDVGDSDSEGKEIQNVTEIGPASTEDIKENQSPDENELVGSLIKEHSWQVTDDDKWNKLEKDLRHVVERLIERHKDSWSGDQYAVMGAIEQVLEGMFQKVDR